jgi:tRNA pseudouridine55 synthase
LKGAAAVGATGVLVVDKPRGPTSHDVVAMVRRALRTREVGHAGTLDPMATGVLVLAIGEATKLVPYLTGATKTYVARLELGKETDTLDAMGQVTIERAVPDDVLGELAELAASPEPELPPRLAAAVAAERARTAQDPPAFSAIQRDGERAYARARRGEPTDLPPRQVRVHRLEITGSGSEPRPWLDLSLVADKGYYVRSLARDVAYALGTVGTLTALRRTASGTFGEAEAIPLPSPPEVLTARIIGLATAARRALPAACLSDAGVLAARFGRRVPAAEFVTATAEGEPAAWLDGAGALVAVGVADEGGSARVLRGFR